MNMKNKLNIKIFADGANKEDMLSMYALPYISGFTTNPSLMRKAGISDYESFAHEILDAIPDRPISFEVFADDLKEMKSQALKITTWGENVYVKIPVSNTRQEMCYELVRELANEGVKVNVTAIFNIDQIQSVADAIREGASSVVSVFAGRIADTGIDPVPVMAEAVNILKDIPQAELLWASPREVLNVYQGDSVGCHIITATKEIIDKLALAGKDLDAYSLETVVSFYKDASEAGYSL